MKSFKLIPNLIIIFINLINLMFIVIFVAEQSALHWAAKHGNEDVVKLIAGTCKADVNARTVGIYVFFEGIGG